MDTLFQKFIKDSIESPHLWNNVEFKPSFNVDNFHYEGCITIMIIEDNDHYSRLFLKHLPQEIGFEMFAVKPGEKYEDCRSIVQGYLNRIEFRDILQRRQKDRKIILISNQDRSGNLFAKLKFDIIINLTDITKRLKIFGKIFIFNEKNSTCKSRKGPVLPYIRINNENNLLKVYIIKRFIVLCCLYKVDTTDYRKIAESVKTEKLVGIKRKQEDDGIISTVIKKMRSFINL